MKKLKLLPLFSVFVLSAMLSAQTKIPVGTIIPVELDSSINAKKCKAGQTVVASVAQDVPLSGGAKIKAGTRVLGEVLAVTPAQKSQPATLAFRFNKIAISGQDMPIMTDLRALASPNEVGFAQVQLSVPDWGSSPPWELTTILIGGDIAYRETGIVERRGETVGKSVYAGNWGVLSKVEASLDGECQGAVPGNDKPQALWVFSHDACGVYGYEAVITNLGRANPEGRIALASTKGNLIVRRGSALLLEVNGADDKASHSEVVTK